MKVFQLKKKFRNTDARIGELKLNNTKINTPIFWFGTLYNSKPYPWEHFSVETVLLNAYDILLKTNSKKNIGPIKSHLRTDSAVLMDSGGFQFQNSNRMSIEPEEILDFYRESKPDIGVVLDHPLTTEEVKDNLKRWRTTLKNTKFMLENSHDILLMPVIHGYTLKMVKNACNEIKKICEPEIIGVGSLVPILKQFKNSSIIKELNGKKSTEFLIDAIKLVREEFQDSLLHVFGVGGATTMHLMYSIGVDSIDSIGWRMKAAFGAIQLPGMGDRFISPNKRRRGMSEKDISLLGDCRCPVCKGRSTIQKMRALDNSKKNTFMERAIHNAYVFNEENKEFIINLKKDNIDNFMENRLKGTKYLGIYNYYRENRN